MQMSSSSVASASRDLNPTGSTRVCATDCIKSTKRSKKEFNQCKMNYQKEESNSNKQKRTSKQNQQKHAQVTIIKKMKVSRIIISK